MKKIAENMRKFAKTAACVVMAAVIPVSTLALPAKACLPYENEIRAGAYHTVCLRTDGTVSAYGKTSDDRCDVGNWTDVIAVSAESPALKDGAIFQNQIPFLHNPTFLSG